MVIHVHKDRIVAGDVIVCPDGRERTVCQSDIRPNSFMGVTILGDSYHGGHKLVQRRNYGPARHEPAIL
jgi:hypothetical protein